MLKPQMAEENANPMQIVSDVIRGVRNTYAPDGKLPPKPCIICAGSFNPLHTAHLQLLKLGEQKTGLPGVFELSITNVDKPSLDVAEIERRMRQFEQLKLPLILTNRPRYMNKLEIFSRGSGFVMGSDTFARLVDLRYYDKAEDPLSVFENFGTKFVVAPRRLSSASILTGEQILQSAGDAGQIQRWATLTICVSPDEFLLDISSTDIRNGLAHPLISPSDGK